MNRYTVTLKKSLTSKDSITFYVRAYSMAHIVDMFSEEYFIKELERVYEWKL